MGIQENLDQIKELAKDTQDSQSVASEQRVANNAIQKAQLNILKFIAGVVFVAALGLVPIAVTDHFVLQDVSKTVATIATAQMTNTKNIEELQKNMPKLGSIWSFGMQLDYARELFNNNKNLNLISPDPKIIQQSHLGDL